LYNWSILIDVMYFQVKEQVEIALRKPPDSMKQQEMILW